MTIQKSALLSCPPDRAFEIFTDRISEWWPKGHRPSKDPESLVFLEASGRFFERATDGREVELGRVREWDRPRRLLLDFYLGTGEAKPTSVEVRFTADAGGTRLEILHEARPESVDVWDLRAPVFDRNWTIVLEAFGTSVTSVLPSIRGGV